MLPVISVLMRREVSFSHCTALPFMAWLHAAAFMGRLVDGLLPSRQIEVTAPSCVEVTVWEQPHLSRTIVHLANRTQHPTDIIKMNELVPVHGVELRLKSPISHPEVSCRGGAIQSALKGGVLSVRLDRLDAYAAIVIEPGRTG